MKRMAPRRRYLFRSAKKKGMPDYRVYTLGPVGRIFNADEMTCDND